MQQLGFEMKKYIFRRSNGVILVLGSFLFAVLLLICEWNVWMDKTSYGKYFAHVGDSYTEEVKEAIQNEYERLGHEIYTTMPDGSLIVEQEQASAQGVYGKTRIEDYALMGTVLECIEAVEKRNQTIQVLLEDNTALNDYYVPEQNHQLVNRKQLDCVVNFAWFGWAACLVVILLLGSSFSIENQRNMLPLLCATKKGEDSLYFFKIMTGCIMAVATNIWFFFLYLVIQWFLLGINSNTFQMPLFLVDGYELCISGMTVGTITMYHFLFGLFVTILTAFVTMTCSKGIGRGIYAKVASVLLFLIGTGADLFYYAIYKNPFVLNDDRWYLVSIAKMYQVMDIEKRWNPFSLLTLQYYFAKPRFLTWNGWQYPVYIFPVIVLIIVSGILIVYLIWNKKKKKV